MTKNPWALHVPQAQGYSTAMNSPDKSQTPKLSDVAEEPPEESTGKERQITGADEQPDIGDTVPPDNAQ